MAVLVIIAIAALIAAVAWYSYQRKRRREQALAIFASRHGLEYSSSDPFGLLGCGFHLFTLGDGRGCEEVLSGSWEGLPVKEADYWYYTESTDGKGNRSRSYRYFSIVVADFEAVMPHVSIQKESLFTRLADHLGFHDIEFESADFNKEFQVKAEDREFAFKLIDARMMEWLLATGGTCGFEVQGPNLLVYAHRLKPEELAPLFDVAKAFQGHVPRLVWNDYGSKTERSPS